MPPAVRVSRGIPEMPAAGLSQRQARILGEIGIDVWELRDKAPEAVAEDHAVTEPTTPEAALPEAPVVAPAADVRDSDWEPLNDAIRACTGCALHASRTQAV